MLDRLRTLVERRHGIVTLLDTDTTLSAAEKASLQREAKFYSKEAQHLIGVLINHGYTNSEIVNTVRSAVVEATS